MITSTRNNEEAAVSCCVSYARTAGTGILEEIYSAWGSEFCFSRRMLNFRLL